MLFLACVLLLAHAVNEDRITDEFYLDFEMEGLYLGTVTVGIYGSDMPLSYDTFSQFCVEAYDGIDVFRIIDGF